MEHVDLPTTTSPVPLHFSLDPYWDRLTAIAFGRCDDGLPEGAVLCADEDERIQFLLETPFAGPVMGFRVLRPFTVDPMALASDEVWDGPRFDVPALGLVRVSVGEVLLATRARFAEDEATADALAFHAAIAARTPAEAEPHWRLALEAGDMKAHYGLGCMLVEAGRPREAYTHLRRYTELVPDNAWAWNWLGQACVALGERPEARRAFRQALDASALGDHDTDAAERLAALDDD